MARFYLKGLRKTACPSRDALVADGVKTGKVEERALSHNKAAFLVSESVIFILAMAVSRFGSISTSV